MSLVLVHRVRYCAGASCRLSGYSGHRAERAPSASVANDESPGGISPPGAPRTVHDPLESHGSRCSTVGTSATGFTSSTGSSCCQMASVGPQLRLNNAAPTVQLPLQGLHPY